MTAKTNAKKILDGLQAITLSFLLTGAMGSVANARDSFSPLSSSRLSSASRTTTATRISTRLPTRPAPAPKPVTLRCAKPDDRGHLRDRWTPPKSTASAYQIGHERTRLVLKLRDDACAKSQNGQLVTSSDRNLQAVAKTIEQYAPKARVVRRFQQRDAELEKARVAGEAAIGQRLADMRQYYWIELDKAWHMQRLIAQLVRQPAVESVYAQSGPMADPGDITNPTTPDFSGELDFWGPAPGGLDIDFALAEDRYSNGEMGWASTIADIESGWNFNHEDLSEKSPYMLYDLGAHGSGNPNAATDHGAAVAGIIVADSDAPGIRGIATGAGFWSVPSSGPDGADDTAQAIIDIALQVVDPSLETVDDLEEAAEQGQGPISRLGANSILLIEKQVRGPNSTGDPKVQVGSMPVEYQQAEFDAIKQATALNITVIEAAGNGGQDLDETSTQSAVGDPAYAVFNRSNRDSGAILVSQATSAAPHGPMASSNRGARVDLYSWGQNIFTLGYGSNNNTTTTTDGFAAGDFDINQRYTNNFGGSSGASAIVAGITALLETEHFAANHSLGGVRHIDPTAIRLMLRTTGTDSANPDEDRIGRQPDLREQLPLMSMGPKVASVFTAEANARTGTAVAPIGDLDGDELGEIIVGSPGENTVRVFSGGSGNVIATFTGSAGDRFGEAVSAIDDIDQDGQPEIMIGAPGAGTGGQVYIYSSRTPQSVLRLYYATEAGTDFGAAVASQGDSNGDGNPEVLVGAPLYDHSYGGSVFANAGRVYSFEGNGSQTPLWTKNGGAGARLGQTIVTGDVLSFSSNGTADGKLDILVGAPYDPVYGNGRTGRVFLYQHTGQLYQIFNGTDEWSNFGTSIAIIGDRDGNGINDFAVGSPGTESERGSVDIYSGQTGSLIQFKMGFANGLRFGTSVAGPGDLNQDGVVDLLVGTPFEAGAHGQVFAISLGSNGNTPLAEYTGQASGDRFGGSLAVIGDLNGDGQTEFVAGAPGSDRGGNESGAAYVFILPTHSY